MAQNRTNARCFFQRKDAVFQKQIQENALLSDFFAKQQQLSIYLSDIEKNCLWTCFRIIEIVFYLYKSQKFQEFLAFLW